MLSESDSPLNDLLPLNSRGWPAGVEVRVKLLLSNHLPVRPPSPPPNATIHKVSGEVPTHRLLNFPGWQSSAPSREHPSADRELGTRGEERTKKKKKMFKKKKKVERQTRNRLVRLESERHRDLYFAFPQILSLSPSLSLLSLSISLSLSLFLSV